jgi:type I restriction enzyme S subunit
MNAETLRNSILQRAIGGKLVPQLDEEPDVEQIGNAPSDIPFEIPEKWKWKRLESVCSDFLVPMRDKPSFTDDPEGIDWCRIEDIQGKYLHGSLSGRRVSKDTIDSMNLKVDPVGTVISACSASIGAAAIVTKPCCTNQTFIGLVPDTEQLQKEYLYYFLLAIKKHLWKIGAGTTIKYISRKKYESLLIPIPPLEEQNRIVQRIEELLPLIEEYGQDQERLEKINKDFPVQMEKSLLHEAISGKLVPQLGNEPEVQQIGLILKEVPFSIPKKWKWVTLGNLIKRSYGGGTPSRSNPNFWNGDIPWASVKDLSGNFLCSTKESITSDGVENSATNIVPVNNVIMCSRMALGKIVVNKIEVAINQDLKVLELDETLVTKEFFITFYKTINFAEISSGTTVKGVDFKKFKNLPFPLPPLDEQKRIVAKLDKLMFEIQKLK